MMRGCSHPEKMLGSHGQMVAEMYAGAASVESGVTGWNFRVTMVLTLERASSER